MFSGLKESHHLALFAGAASFYIDIEEQPALLRVDDQPLLTWLDSWSGVGHVAVGMARQGYDLQLTRYDEKGWRATFYTTGMEHSPTSEEHGPEPSIPA
jgi:hypothetical protein